MFKLRLMSTLVLLPLVIAGILFLPNLYIAIFSGAIISIAAWEWLHMTVLKNSKIRFILLAALIFLAISLLAIGIHPLWIYYFSLIWWLVAFIGICYYPDYTEIWHQHLFQPVVGLLLFLPGWLSFNTLHDQRHGPIYVLLGCALIWGADIGAYCFGRLWGKTKLAPTVSPNKTIAGLYGAFLTGFVIMLLFYITVKPNFNLFGAIWLALVTVGFAVIGDLFESMLKRIYGVKDSGNIIPGHGGMFDRLDSMVAAFPVYFLGLQILRHLGEMQL